MMDEQVLEKAGQQLESASDILIVSHIRPDGDAVGSVLGLGLALQASGKRPRMVLADGVPEIFRHLPGSDLIHTQPDGSADLVVVLDSSDAKRLGGVLGENPVPDLNVDHHVTNLNYGRVNLVDPTAVATAAILAEHMPTWGLPINLQVAEALLTGILTDTLGFRTSNTDSRALRLAADLVDYGVDISELYLQALVQRPFVAARLWALGLARLQREGGLLWTSLTMADRQAVGYPGRDDADLINFLSAIRESEVSIIFHEQPGGRVKVSWRARPGLDVAQIALSFGGGGHPSAAGAEIEGDLEQVQQAVLQTTRTLFASA
jgi:phosphoesterase RecJ-like protein